MGMTPPERTPGDEELLQITVSRFGDSWGADAVVTGRGIPPEAYDAVIEHLEFVRDSR